MTEPRTYTTAQVAQLLGYQSTQPVHYIAKRWPSAFVRVRPGRPHNNKGAEPTLWDADKLDEFIKWRKERESFKEG